MMASLTIYIACLGLFGLATYNAEQRTKEIVGRKVVGASVGSVVAYSLKPILMALVLTSLIA